MSVIKRFIKRFRRMSLIYRYLRDGLEVSKKPTLSTLGFNFQGNNIMKNGIFEPEETRIFMSLVKQVDTFVNIGANIGYYSCIALNLEKHVVAFEPIEHNVKILMNNIAANNWESRVEIYPIALSNGVGITKIHGGGTGASLIEGWAGADDNYFTLIPTSTLDLVLNTRFSGRKLLILVDIEGSEKMMLEGATSIISMTPKPIWIMEITFNEYWSEEGTLNPNLIETFNFFWKNDYDSWLISNQPRIVLAHEILSMVESGIDTLIHRNFIFIEKGLEPYSIK